MKENTERWMIAILMNWVMFDKHHIFAIPNSTVFFPWEADLASATEAMLAHEFEIKVSVSDFNRDRDKKWKHMRLQNPNIYQHGVTPNYFWYATLAGMDVKIPEYAGWLVVEKHRQSYVVVTKKDAPRLHTKKLEQKSIDTIARLLSFRLQKNLWSELQREPAQEVE